MANVIKTLSLTLGSKEVSCQLDQAELTDSPTSESITTFCGTEESVTPAYRLTLGGFTDYGAVDSVCDILHNSYITPDADGLPTPIAFVLTVGKATRTGTCRPLADVPFGGTAGNALKFSVTLGVIGTPVDGVVTPAA